MIRVEYEPLAATVDMETALRAWGIGGAR